MENPSTEENSPSSVRSSPSGSSTSSKHSNHTLEQSNTISYDITIGRPTGTEPPRKRLKTNEDESERVTQSAASQPEELTSSTVEDKEIESLTATFENDPLDIEGLAIRFLELNITNDIKLPTDQDFLTTENMFRSHHVPFPVNMSSISVYKFNQNSSLTIGIVSNHQPLDLPNGIISLENAEQYNLYQGS